MQKSGIPIFCFHLGPAPYVRLTMRQARIWNPNSEIYLLTDQPAENYPEVTVVNLREEFAKYCGTAAEFQSVYQHMSANPYDNELMCFQRWFVLSDVLKHMSYNRCFVMDSDVLLYADISAEHRKYSHFKFTLTHQMSPGECYFDTEIIHEIAAEMMDTYKKRNNRIWYMLKAWGDFIEAVEKNGGMSDMAFLYLFSPRYSGHWGESMHIFEDATFDHHINTGIPGFEINEKKQKKFVWKDNQPYGLHIASGKLIRFMSLHFQGGSKTQIPEFVRDRLPSSIAG